MGLKMALLKLKDSSLWMMTSYDNLICQFWPQKELFAKQVSNYTKMEDKGTSKVALNL